MVEASLTEELVFNSPRGMRDYRAYRIEYGGHARECLVEGRIWLPRWVDSDAIEELINQEEPH